MLSIDVTDRQVRIVSGEYSNGKIKVRSAVSQELDKEIVVNGMIINTSLMASKICVAVKSKQMREHEAIISISSNLIIFKELHIPPAKQEQFAAIIKNQMLLSMGIADEYKISYTLAGDIVKNGTTMKKVLVIACPQNIVNSYRELFSILSPKLNIKMKSIIVSCNCLTKIIMASDVCNQQMPMLFVQLDSNFINLNIYDDNELAFTKYVKINKNDYNSGEDYSIAAISDNIFRMLQFYRGLSKQSISEVFVYGDLTNYDDLSAVLASFDIPVNIFEAPDFVSGCDNSEFSLYANAIGALYKRNKAVEHINLISADMVRAETSGKSFLKSLGILAASCTAVVLVLFILLSSQIYGIQSQINMIDSYLSNDQIVSQIQKLDTKEATLADLKLYAEKAKLADEQFSSKPKITAKILNVLEENAGTDVKIISINQLDEVITVSLEAVNQQAPSQYVDKLAQTQFFDSISYNGFQKETDKIRFTIELTVKGGDLG